MNIRFVVRLLLTLIIFNVCGSCNPAMQQWVLHDGRIVYSIPLIAFTPRVTVSERKAFIAGIEKWNRATHGGIAWQEIDYVERYLYDDGYVVMGHCQPFIVIDSVDSSHHRIKEHEEKSKRQTMGLIVSNNDCTAIRIWMVRDRISNMRAYANVAAHEFGHALGLGHIKNNKTLMSKFYNDRKCKGCVTNDDAKKFCKEYDCDPRTLRRCK